MATITLWLSRENRADLSSPTPPTLYSWGCWLAICETMVEYITKVLALEWNWLLLCLSVFGCEITREAILEKKYLGSKLISSAFVVNRWYDSIFESCLEAVCRDQLRHILGKKKKKKNLLYTFPFTEAIPAYVRAAFVLFLYCVDIFEKNEMHCVYSPYLSWLGTKGKRWECQWPAFSPGLLMN